MLAAGPKVYADVCPSCLPISLAAFQAAASSSPSAQASTMSRLETMSSRCTRLVRRSWPSTTSPKRSLMILTYGSRRMQGVQVLQVGQDQPVRRGCVGEGGDCAAAPMLTSIVPFYRSVRATQGKGVMPDGTTRFKCKGKDIYHFVSSLARSGFRARPGPIVVIPSRTDGHLDLCAVHGALQVLGCCDPQGRPARKGVPAWVRHHDRLRRSNQDARHWCVGRARGDIEL